VRPSQKSKILDAAVRLVGAVDGAEITLDAVARLAGMTKPGLMYHFPTKEALMLAVVEHKAAKWEDAMLLALGVPFEQSTPQSRVAAYAQVTAAGDFDRSDYAIFSDAAYWPVLKVRWVARMAKWFDLPAGLPAAERARLTLVRLAADGLWAADATDVFRPSGADRAAVVALIAGLAKS
jgi:AcrR family transcriptional regulator